MNSATNCERRKIDGKLERKGIADRGKEMKKKKKKKKEGRKGSSGGFRL
ncbi:hypothetical protein TIFTF001_012546 [Ficus carica]|uniref:Uncharacterized protein n=1 Tax=Ficus carica TaxID=3494 RepID=A0AA88D1W4_FICCA|nr:hypothetical protein TIFTF001_012546 [Ficus carica]